MAVHGSNYSSNSVQGVPQIGVDVDIYRVDTVCKYDLGHRITRQDGSEYVYCQFGAAVNRGLIVAPDISETGSATVIDNAVIAPASAVAVPEDRFQPGAAGSRYVEITLASIAADVFAGAYLVISDGTGVGYTYRIRGNTATDNPATGNIRLTLYDPLAVALVATSDVMIVPNRFANLEAATTGTDNFSTGVTCATMALGEFGWVCQIGVVGGIADGTIAIGEAVTLSDSEAGQFQAAAGGSTAVADLIDEIVIGQCVVAAGASTEHAAFAVNFK